MDDVVCSGSEESVMTCRHNEIGSHNCNWETECIELFCRGGGPRYGASPLVHSSRGIISI